MWRKIVLTKWLILDSIFSFDFNLTWGLVLDFQFLDIWHFVISPWLVWEFCYLSPCVGFPWLSWDFSRVFLVLRKDLCVHSSAPIFCNLLHLIERLFEVLDMLVFVGRDGQLLVVLIWLPSLGFLSSVPWRTLQPLTLRNSIYWKRKKKFWVMQ